MVIKEAEIRTLDVEKMERKGSYLPMFPLSEGGGGNLYHPLRSFLYSLCPPFIISFNLFFYYFSSSIVVHILYVNAVHCSPIRGTVDSFVQYFLLFHSSLRFSFWRSLCCKMLRCATSTTITFDSLLAVGGLYRMDGSFKPRVFDRWEGLLFYRTFCYWPSHGYYVLSGTYKSWSVLEWFRPSETTTKKPALLFSPFDFMKNSVRKGSVSNPQQRNV